MSTTEIFEHIPGFCPACGSILPPLGKRGNVTCSNCSRNFSPKVFRQAKVSYTLSFNTREAFKKNAQDVKKHKEDTGEEGPVVEKKCPKCGNERMSYATVQLRSADEGQTVFYTCTKCKFKESENS